MAPRRRRCFLHIRQVLSPAPPRAVIGDLARDLHAQAPKRRRLQEEQERRRDGVQSIGTEGLRGGEKRRVAPAAADQLLLALELQRVRCGAELFPTESAEVRGDKRGRVPGAGEGVEGENGERDGAEDFLRREADRRAGGAERAAEGRQRGVGEAAERGGRGGAGGSGVRVRRGGGGSGGGGSFEGG